MTDSCSRSAAPRRSARGKGEFHNRLLLVNLQGKITPLTGYHRSDKLGAWVPLFTHRLSRLPAGAAPRGRGTRGLAPVVEVATVRERAGHWRCDRQKNGVEPPTPPGGQTVHTPSSVRGSPRRSW